MRLRRATDDSRRRGQREEGFSLLEVVIAMGLLAIVMAVMSSSLWQVQRSETYSRGRSEALDDMRTSINRMTKDLRQASSINGEPTATSLDVNTYIDGTQARIEYDMSGDALVRRVNGGSAVTLLTELTPESAFTYTPDATAPDLVTIVLSVKPSNLPDTTLELNAEVTFRNR